MNSTKSYIELINNDFTYETCCINYIHNGTSLMNDANCARLFYNTENIYVGVRYKDDQCLSYLNEISYKDMEELYNRIHPYYTDYDSRYKNKSANTLTSNVGFTFLDCMENYKMCSNITQAKMYYAMLDMTMQPHNFSFLTGKLNCAMPPELAHLSKNQTSFSINVNNINGDTIRKLYGMAVMHNTDIKIRDITRDHNVPVYVNKYMSVVQSKQLQMFEMSNSSIAILRNQCQYVNNSNYCDNVSYFTVKNGIYTISSSVTRTEFKLSKSNSITVTAGRGIYNMPGSSYMKHFGTYGSQITTGNIDKQIGTKCIYDRMSLITTSNIVAVVPHDERDITHGYTHQYIT